MWISKRGEPMPQAITLDLGKAKAISRIQIAFDAMHEDYTRMPYNCDKRVSDMLVRDYAAEVFDGETWRTIASVEGNYNRFRVHEFEPVTASKARITVKKVQDEANWTARIHEIRVY